MPKLLFARPALDALEARQVHKLASSRHAPGDWIRRAKMVVWSWQGLRTTAIATELRCHPQTVRERLTAFNTRGLDGLGDRPGAGRKRRITEAQRSMRVEFGRSGARLCDSCASPMEAWDRRMRRVRRKRHIGP